MILKDATRRIDDQLRQEMETNGSSVKCERRQRENNCIFSRLGVNRSAGRVCLFKISCSEWGIILLDILEPFVKT